MVVHCPRHPGIFLLMILVVPLHAQVPAQSSSSSSKPKAAQSPLSAPDAGSITNGLYRNSTFGFTYKLPVSWVDRTRDMSEDSNEDSNTNSNAPKKSILLLAVFERPPEATGDSVNSAVVVAAEAASAYPGLRNAEHYFGPLTELTKSKGFNVVNQPYDYSVGAKPLVRGDFGKPIGSLTMHQSTLVMMEKGYVVSFTFIGGSEEEVSGLVEGLSFGRKETPAPHK
jgi:hypothetical protein